MRDLIDFTVVAATPDEDPVEVFCRREYLPRAGELLKLWAGWGTALARVEFVVHEMWLGGRTEVHVRRADDATSDDEWRDALTALRKGETP